jgi:hypothetical protein
VARGTEGEDAASRTGLPDSDTHLSGRSLATLLRAEDGKVSTFVVGDCLEPTLALCFKIHREYLVLHGGLSVVHATEASVALPEGHRGKVATIPLRIWGKAAALTDGRTADGCIDVDLYAEDAQKKITLARHYAYRLRAATLEPVARPGDMLLVKEPGEPSVKSLVVAISDDRIVARRFEVAEGHAEIACSATAIRTAACHNQ